MRVSDYIFQYLRDFGVGHVFTLTGGGAMYLVDSLGRSGIGYVCCHHEQAAAIAAQAYGMYDDSLGVCLVTTGPGGTNALTATAAAYTDSTPMLFLSGQVKRADFASLRGVRQFGAQENDIVAMAKPVTKYAALLTEPADVAYELEKCVYTATHGRKGPVWLDIPLDVQSAEIDASALRHFSPPEEAKNGAPEAAAREAVRLLCEAERPLVLLGYGTASSGAQGQVRQFLKRTGVPLLTTWRMLDFTDAEDDGFFGSPGLQAPRYANLILQHCDFLLVLGSRLDNMITAFSEEHFAFRAKKVIVDIDENELKKLAIPHALTVAADARDFCVQLLEALEGASLPDFSRWMGRCRAVRERFPLLAEKQDRSEGVDLYRVTDEISRQAGAEDIIAASSTSRCNTAGHIAFRHRRGQRVISSMGMGSMGFALPSAVGAYFAGKGKRVIVLEGDGSLQLNIQELQTVVSNGVNAKIFVFDNRGYAAIATMQERNFDGFYVGSTEGSGVAMPDMEKIAAAYGLPFARIASEREIGEKVRWALEQDGACIVDIAGALSFDEIPKCVSRVDETTGQRVSAYLENPYPFLSDAEMEEAGRLLLG